MAIQHSEVERKFSKCDNPTDKIINCQLDIKFEHFMEEEYHAVLKKIKSRKTAVLDEIPHDL